MSIKTETGEKVVVLPSQCGRDCTRCIVYQSSGGELWLESIAVCDHLPVLMEKCRECPGWEEGKTVCWGSICPLRICCQNCGVSSAFQCRKHPCRQFLQVGPD